MKHKLAVRDEVFLFCPKCMDNLVSVYHQDVEVDYCLKCSGVWVDPFEERDLIEGSHTVLTVDQLKRLRQLYRPPENTVDKSYVPCPVCRQLMNRKNWGSFSGVIVDECRDHGTWYDHGELEKISEYVRLGGLEYEKFRTLEKSVSDTDHKLLKLAYNFDRHIQHSSMRAKFFHMLGF